MNKEKQLLKNTAIISIGKICTQVITFFLLPLYTAVLSTEEYGIVDILNTLVSLLIPIVTLQVEQATFRFLLDAQKQENEQKRIITSVVFFSILQIIVYIMVFAIVSPWIHNTYKYFLVANLVVTVFSSIFLQISRGLRDNVTYTIGSFLSGFFTVILNVILIVAFHMGAYGILIATFIGNLICVIYIIFKKKVYQYIKFSYFDKNLLKKMLKYSVPLVPNMISWWVVNASDRTIVTAILGVATNGIYSAANKFSGVFFALNGIFNITWTESAVLNIEEKDKDSYFSRIFSVTIRVFGSLCLGVIALMPFVFPILINEKFGDAYYQIPILMVGIMFNILVSFLGSIYVAKKLTKEISKTSILAAIINIVVNLLLIQYIGLYAASLSTAIAYFSMFFYRYIDSKKYVKIKINSTFVLSLIAVYAITIFTYYIRNLLLSGIIALGVIFYTMYINRNNAKFIIDIVKKKILKK